MHRHKARSAMAVAIVLASIQTAQAEPVKIRIGWNTMPVDLISIAWREPKTVGMKYEGVTYTAEPMNFGVGGGTQLTALAAGRVDVAMGPPPLIAQAATNAKLNAKVIVSVLQDPCDGKAYTQAFYVKNGSGLNTVADLKGKTVAVSAIGSGNDTSLNMALAKAGLTTKDITKVEVGVGAIPAFLKEGKVQAGVILPQFEPEMDASDFKKLFTQCEALGPVEMISLFTTAEFIEKNRAALTDMVTDLMLATRWFKDPKNKDEAIRIAADATKQPRQSYDFWLFRDKGDYGRDSNLRPDIRGLQSSIDQAMEFGVLKAKINVSPDYLDLSLIEEARKRLDAK